MSLLRFTQPLIAVDELEDGVPKTLQIGDEFLVVVRRGEKFSGFPARCPHRGTSLEHAHLDDQGGLVCPYHGWRVGADGQVSNAQREEQKNCRFESFRVEVHWGYVWLVQGNSLPPIAGHSKLQYFGAQGFTLSAPFHVVLDNFNEGSHTPFVHSLTGPEPSQMNEITFSWLDHPDHVEIRYRGPQRKNIAFQGLSALIPGKPRRKMIWDIVWRTYFNPVYMVYDSVWFWEDKPDKIESRVRHFYYVAPLGDKQTQFHSFGFAEFPGIPSFLHPIYRMFARHLTKNQVMEDERFYQKIRDLPMGYEGMHLDRYDVPVVRIRKRANTEYLG